MGGKKSCIYICRNKKIRDGHGQFPPCRYSERSNTKCVGITIETRPDYCLKRHLSDMLGYGCTRLEIGVQSVYEDVARDTNRSAGKHGGGVLWCCMNSLPFLLSRAGHPNLSSQTISAISILLSIITTFINDL